MSRMDQEPARVKSVNSRVISVDSGSRFVSWWQQTVVKSLFIISPEFSIITQRIPLVAAVFMQNLIVFCRQCFAWVEPHGEMCPDCGMLVILDQPDLDQESLAKIIGNPLIFLGPVRVERPRLPNYGDLLGTSEGLLFVPRLHRRLNGAWEEVASNRIPGWWPFRGEQSANRFLDWLRRPSTARLSDPKKGESVEASPLSGSLSERLMDSPGGFFMERRFIRGMTCRRKTVRIERSPFRSMTLVDESEDTTLPAALESLEMQTGPFASVVISGSSS